MRATETAVAARGARSMALPLRRVITRRSGRALAAADLGLRREGPTCRTRPVLRA